jgi:hypothetical protein
MLADRSAAIVTLLDTAHLNRVLLLGGNRPLTAVVGVLAALAVGLIFTPRRSVRMPPGRCGPAAPPADPGLLAAQAAALIRLRGSDSASPDPAIGFSLDRAAEALDGTTDNDELIRLMDAAVGSAKEHPQLRDVLVRLEGALRNHLGAPAREV